MSKIERGEMIRKVILEKIIWYIKKHGYSPSVKDIGDMVGLKSKSSVHNHLNKLREQGKIETDHEFAPRSIRIPGYKFVKENEDE